jgi:phenylacetate-CoA ligase
MRKTPLEQWIAMKTGLKGTEALTMDALRQLQLASVRKTIAYAARQSLFYRDHLRGYDPERIKTLSDLASFPFTTQHDLAESGLQFLCVSQSDIERVITLLFPGFEDIPRRAFFTPEDLELTVDFFHHGMATLVKPGWKVLILLPGDRPGSVGDLLVTGLRRMDVQGIVHGIVQDPAAAIREIVEQEIDCLVGIPAQVLSIVRHEQAETIPSGRIKSILLSADYVPGAVVEELERLWECVVFSHYGTTEMGLGGGVECEALSGYHMREADLFFEIIDPDTGRPQPDGTIGEVVFTTLTRRGMPLIRYRTGDLAAFLTDPCPCGTVLPTMDKVRGRIRDMVRLRTGDWLGIPDLDDTLFSLPGIVNFTVSIAPGRDRDHMTVEIYPAAARKRHGTEAVVAALQTIPQIGSAISDGCLQLEPVSFTDENKVMTGTIKRTINRKPEQRP